MIVVTAPTSQIGQQVLDRLLDAGQQVRVVVRDPGRLPAEALDRVEVVVGSHGDPGAAREAFTGAGVVFWLTPPDPTAASVTEAYLGFAQPGVQALVEAGVPRVVGVSALGRGTPVAGRGGYCTASLAVDDLIAATGVHYRALVMPSFMDNVARQATALREDGLLTSIIGADRVLPWCATADIAAAAVDLLIDATWTGVAEVPLLGAADLSFTQMAGTLTDVLGRPVRFEQLPVQAHREQLLAAGMSPAMAQAMIDMAQAKADGLDDGVPRTDVTTTPTTFEQWARTTLGPQVQTA